MKVVEPVHVATDAELMQRVQPRYPVLALNQEHEGTVILSVIVGSYGRPLGVSIYRSSGHTELDQAALEAAWGSIFKPPTSNGTPTAQVYLLEYVFRLMR